MMCLLSLATLSLFIYSHGAAAEDLCDDVAEVSMLQVGLDRGRGTGTSDSQPAAAATHDDVQVPDTSEWLEMARLQAAIYFDSDVPGWTKLARMEVTPILSPDHMIIYAKDGVCALTFHGCNDPIDFAEGSNRSVINRCGNSWHGGWWPELMHYLQDPRWESEIVPILTGPQCSHVYTVGHSMGGFLSGLFAACANMDDLVEVSPGMQAITVEKVYSFGAPAIATNAPRNALSSSGCFKGARFFINDATEYDFAPALWFPFSTDYRHPYLPPVNLALDRETQLTCTSPGACSSAVATEAPRGRDLEYEATEGSGIFTPKYSSHALHDQWLYVTRIATALAGTTAELSSR
mmetsp:Transcript_47361/g.112647  ORF Transcript_47361/g.112647 Transcript_47361/m.112647 type:complete len:349 (+) Transcript_47361:71-1117(+)